MRVFFYNFFIILYILFFFYTFCIATVHKQGVLIWKSFGDQASLQFDDPFPDRFYLADIKVNFDAVGANHLVRLDGLSTQSWIDKKDLYKALTRLSVSKRYDHILINYSIEDSTVSLFVEVMSNWRLAKVKVNTSLLGKDRYRNLYRIMPGEPFDPIKHADSLQAIEKALRDIGYCAAEVIDIIEYNEASRTVQVVLALEPKDLYKISTVTVQLSEKTSNASVGLLITKLKRRAVRDLHGLFYSEELLANIKAELEEYVLHEGFLQTTIAYTLTPNHDRQLIDVAFEITLAGSVCMRCIGNHFFTTKNIFERFALFGGSLSLLPPSILIEELIEYYKEHGFWHVQISCQEDEDQLIFCIKEGERVAIKKLNMAGIHHFSEEQIRAWCSLLDSPHFEKQKQRAFRSKLLQEYLRVGFWDCRVMHESFEQLGSSQAYCYSIVVNEGQQKKLRSVNISGVEASDSLLSGYVASYEEPIPFDFYMVQEQRRLLLTDLQKQGYLKAHVKPLLQESESGIIDLIWHIEHSYKIYCGAIIDASVTRLPFYYIQRELFVEPGQLVTKALLDRSLSKLKKLRIFDQASIQCVESIEHNQRDVVVTCIDDDPFELRLRAGTQFIGSNMRLIDLGVRYGGSFIWKNPSNHADYIRSSFDNSPYWRYGEMVYTLPWLGQFPVRTSFSLYGSRFDEPLFYCFRERLYRLTQGGGIIELEDDHGSWQWGVSCGFESMKISHIAKPLASLIDFAPSFVDRRILYLALEPCLITRGVDDLIAPRYGSLFSCFAKLFLPLQKKGENSGYFKIVGEASFFVPFLYESVFATHFRFGHMFVDNFKEILPSERFYLGGAYSLRGYGTDMAPPVRLCKRYDNKWCLLPIGGKTILSTMFELRFPLYKSIGAAIFNDCGILAQSNFFQHNFVGATGFGLRYATPVGALRFDVAWKWLRHEHESHPFTWFLTLGEAF